VKQGRDTPADTFVDLLAGAGNDASAFAVINQTLSAGHVLSNINKALGEANAP
jgi:hypothetical protein